MTSAVKTHKFRHIFLRTGMTIVLGGVTLASRAAIATAAIEPERPSPSGMLRVSNRSEHPIRLALRLKVAKLQNSKYSDKYGNKYGETLAQPSYETPAHWDFFAGEGSDRGLLVGLPNRSLNLTKGDIVVAFAQDGSQRYWGPFIVGEVSGPTWNETTQEWKLILEN
ncbi:MAG: hypothetical protein NT070_02745 [Cyanobacteria bacterium]|nr:hypothetical protein [Cyanobacteriota bacterium]